MLTLLSNLFVTERHRLRAGNVGHSMPLASEIDIDNPLVEPLLISSTRNTFLETRIARGGYARFGFSECDVDHEAALLLEFHRVFVERAKLHGWACLERTVDGALATMRSNGVRPAHLVAGPWISQSAVTDVKVLDAGFPEGVALLAAEPTMAGLHTRVGDYVGVLAYQVNRTFVAVTP